MSTVLTLYLLREGGSGYGHGGRLTGCEGAAGGDRSTDVGLGCCGDGADGGSEGGEADVRAERGYGRADHGHDRESDERHLHWELRRQKRHGNGRETQQLDTNKSAGIWKWPVTVLRECESEVGVYAVAVCALLLCAGDVAWAVGDWY